MILKQDELHFMLPSRIFKQVVGHVLMGQGRRCSEFDLDRCCVLLWLCQHCRAFAASIACRALGGMGRFGLASLSNVQPWSVQLVSHIHKTFATLRTRPIQDKDLISLPPWRQRRRRPSSIRPLRRRCLACRVHFQHEYPREWVTSHLQC